MATRQQPRVPTASTSSQPAQQLTPARIFSTLNAFKQSQALKAAIELELFTAIGEGNDTAAKLALRLQASERGCRILCDFLTVDGFLTKSGEHYALTPESALFLDRKSPAYIGSVTGFLLHPTITVKYDNLAACVKSGGSVSEDNDLDPDHPIWQEFARNMAPMMRMPAQAVAELVLALRPDARRVLDIAAGHGLYGITVAQKSAEVEVTAVDWKGVLNVALENAQHAGVVGRYHALPGSAFDVEFGTGYEVALVTGFVHHFDAETNTALLRKVRNALAPRGLIAVLEFVPNEDRISPPEPAQFALTMLGATPSGDVYTFSEFEEMFERAELLEPTLHELPLPMLRLVTGHIE